MTALRHVGIVVKDLNKSYEFYNKFFGFSEHKKNLESGTFIDKILNFDSISVTTLKMLSSCKKYCVELLKFNNPKLDNSSAQSFYSRGITHVAFTVKDLDNLYSSLLESGYKFLSEPSLSDSKEAKVAFCYGPDNELLELVEEK